MGDQKIDAFKLALERNAEWCEKTAQSDSTFFVKCAKGQEPKILWIGCADSRLPETTILGLNPGEVFVHRNIANILTPADVNSLSVIEYAVTYLKVEHIVVCGHTSCGGVNAALGNQKLGVIDLWLQPMRLLRMKHTKELEKLTTEEKATRLAQLNVINSLDVLKMNSTVIDALRDRGLQLHGAMYHLSTGKLETLNVTEGEHEFAERVAAFDTK